MSLADRIKDRLKATAQSPAELARAVKVKAPSVSAWLSGDTKTIKGENLLLAARALQCSPDWLATGRGNSAVTVQGAAPPGEDRVTRMADPVMDEATSILQSLDRPARREALQWLRGFAAGKKTGSGDGVDLPLAPKKSRSR